MAETKVSMAGGAKAKPSHERDDGGKGKGTVVRSVASPASGKKKRDGLGGKWHLPHAVQKAMEASVSKSVEVRGKTSLSSSTETITKTTKKKSTTARVRGERKVYTLPGQKYHTPEERAPLRIFYESLSKQIPSSEMAEFSMMEHGLLAPEKAKNAYVRNKQKRQQQLKTATPSKSSKPQRPESTKKPQLLKNGDNKARKRVNYSDDDKDFTVKHKK